MASRRLSMAILDWVTILGVTTIALLLASVPPDSHAFSVLDLSISYPHRESPKVPPWLLVVLAILLPITSITALTLLPLRGHPVINEAGSWSTKLWSMHTSLKGLGISLGSSTIAYTGVKNLSGKPRPDFLAICQPRLDEIATYTVGGYGQQISNLWVMVDRGICAQPDNMWLHDGLRSFPSGYATISFAGLFYLTLWLCGRFEVILSIRHHDSARWSPRRSDAEPLMEQEPNNSCAAQNHGKNDCGQPAYFLFLPYLPLGLAIFIAGTRYFDFRNHGFDVLVGSAGGTIFAWVGYRWCSPHPMAATRRVEP